MTRMTKDEAMTKLKSRKNAHHRSFRPFPSSAYLADIFPFFIREIRDHPMAAATPR